MMRVAEFGFIFDIDGVFLRGGRVIDRAKQALSLISDPAGNFRVPTLFVTNAGNMTRHDKAKKLNVLLDSRISADQLIMSHSPLRVFKHLHNRHILGSGQKVVSIAKFLGFQKVSTIDDVRQHFPYLDALNYPSEEETKRENDKQPGRFDRIEAIVLFEDPKRWETNLQLIIDLIMMNGDLHGQRPPENVPKLPVIACSKDLVWMSEATLPRFAHGSFLFALETLYQQIAGKPLEYYAILGKPSPITYAYAESKLHEQARTANRYRNADANAHVKRVYCVGDNLETDVCGANWYNRLAAASRHRRQQGQSVSAPTSTESQSQANAAPQSSNTPDSDSTRVNLSTLLPASLIDECVSILVRTGVSPFQSSRRCFYASEPSASASALASSRASADLGYAESDWALTPDLLRTLMRTREFSEPRHVVDDVYDAVQLVMKLESQQLTSDGATTKPNEQRSAS